MSQNSPSKKMRVQSDETSPDSAEYYYVPRDRGNINIMRPVATKAVPTSPIASSASLAAQVSSPVPAPVYSQMSAPFPDLSFEPLPVSNQDDSRGMIDLASAASQGSVVAGAQEYYSSHHASAFQGNDHHGSINVNVGCNPSSIAPFHARQQGRSGNIGYPSGNMGHSGGFYQGSFFDSSLGNRNRRGNEVGSLLCAANATHNQAPHERVPPQERIEPRDPVDISIAPVGFTTTITQNDVLCGRGTGPNDHSGNQNFRTLVAKRKKEYLATSNRQVKAKIAQSIMDVVRTELNPPGRFLRKVESTLAREKGYGRGVNVYCLVDEEVALEKTKQALRQHRMSKEEKLVQEEEGNNNLPPSEARRGSWSRAA